MIPPLGAFERRPGGRDESSERGPGSRDGDLLAEDRADDELEAVERAGHADPGRSGDQRREFRITGERGVDRHGVGIEVERPASPLAEPVEVGRPIGRDLNLDVVTAGRHRDHHSSALFPHGAHVRAVPYLLDARDGADAEERQERVGRERRSVGEPEDRRVAFVTHAGQV